MMQKFSIVLAFLLVNAVTSTYVPRAAPGTQFITGPCQSDADCASGCCGFNSGKCAGAVIAQERDGGCGFGDAAPNNRAAQVIQGPNAETAPGVNSNAAANNGAAGAAAGTSPAPAVAPGTQFITGPCQSDADCASGCCGFNSGRCAGAVIAQERDGGCGFGDAAPNNRAAQAIQGPNAEAAPGVIRRSPAPIAPGTQFITGACTGDVDCASGCCGFNTGKCAGAVIAQERDGGCGFGDAAPNNRAAQAIQGPNAEAAPGVNNKAAANNGAAGTAAGTSPAPAIAPGTQFITGPCTSDADCASGCCGFNSGKCAGAVIAQERDGGCGFGDAAPNNRAAQAIQGPNAEAAPGVNNNAAPAANNGAAGAAAGAAGPVAAGTQFITGPCSSDTDCASGCCGFNSGKCAGAIVAQERDGGCGFGDAQPNDRAAQALRARGLKALPL